jgi:Zn-dependent protease with chaperone function
MRAQGGDGRGQPEIASTHPSDATRIAALQAYLTGKGW